jgi:hypothetical protein
VCTAAFIAQRPSYFGVIAVPPKQADFITFSDVARRVISLRFFRLPLPSRLSYPACIVEVG